MADFLGEPNDRRDDDKPKRPSLDDVKAPTPPKHQQRKPEQRQGSNMQQFARDFRDGLSSLNTAVDRLSKLPTSSKPPAQSGQRAPERVTHETRRVERTVERATQPKQATPPKQEAAPKRSTPPQAPQPVARPKSPNDKTAALIKTAKAKEAGRLPFVPRETREKAEQVITKLQTKQSDTPIAHSPKRDLPHNALQPSASNGPRVVQSDANVPTGSQKLPPALPPYRSEKKKKPPKPEFKAQTPPSRETPVTERQAQKLEQEIPRFQTQGATVGDLIAESNEAAVDVDGVSVAFNRDSQEAAGSELAPNKSAVTRGAAVDKRRSTPSTDTTGTAAAPATTQRSNPTTAGATNTGGGGVAGAAGAGGGGGKMTVSGTLKVEGLQDNGNAIAQLNARVVDIESEIQNG